MALIINKSIKVPALGFETLSDRIIIFKLHAQPLNLNITQVYEPTAASTSEVIENFYGTLTHAIKRCPTREILLVLGDLNTSVEETKNDVYPAGAKSKYGLGTRIERGKMLL